MVPLLAAILLASAAGAGPVLVSDACGQDTTTTAGDNDATTRCAVENIDRSMRAKTKPAELKVSLCFEASRYYCCCTIQSI